MTVNIGKFCRVIWLILPFFVFFTPSIHATNLVEITSQPTNTWFMGIGGGTTNTSMSSNTSVVNGSGYPPPNNQDTYTIKSPSNALVQYNVGYRWHEANQYVPYYNVYLQYRHYIGADIKGTVDQYSLPGFVNYGYRMSYEADLFTLNGKFDLIEYKKILPYVSGGIGAILNHVNNYRETAAIGVTPRTSPAYNGITQTKLALTLGAGIDYIVTDNVWATLGYEHVFQGDIKSGSGNGSWSPTSLSFGNVKMDTFFLNISANFPQAFRS